LSVDFVESEHPRNPDGTFRHDGSPVPVMDMSRAITDMLSRISDAGLDDWPTKGPVAQRILGDAKDTQDLHSNGAGQYTMARKQVHDQAIGDSLAGPVGEVLGANHAITRKLRAGGTLDADEKQQVRTAAARKRNGQPPRALFLAGGPASGKTTGLNASPELQPAAAVTVNPDDMKDKLPEYRQMIDGGDKFAANGAHEESSDLAKRLTDEATDLKLNVILDGTGDSGEGKFVRKITAQRNAGYEVDALYVTIPTNTAVERAIKRARKSGRWVPTLELRNQHRNVSANFPSVAALPFLSRIDVWDSTGQPPPTLVYTGRDGMNRVVDQELFDTFIAKKDE
jgi:predicted ABC-type ATPase